MKKYLYASMYTVILILLLVQLSGFSYEQNNMEQKSHDDNKYIIESRELSDTETDTGRDEDVLIKAFMHSKADIIETNINSWAKVNEVFMREDEMEELCRELSIRLGVIDDNPEVEIIVEDDYKEVLMRGNTADGRMTAIMFQSMAYKWNDGADTGTQNSTFLVIDIVEYLGFGNTSEAIEIINEIFYDFGLLPDTTICLTGSIDGKLEAKQMEAICSHVLSSVNGVEVEAYRNNVMVSITGYTKGIDNKMVFGNTKINLNVAMRYNSYEEKTNIWIATPLITTGY